VCGSVRHGYVDTGGDLLLSPVSTELRSEHTYCGIYKRAIEPDVSKGVTAPIWWTSRWVALGGLEYLTEVSGCSMLPE